MAFKDYLLALARGGLPEALDTGLNGRAQGDNRPETTAPAGTTQDRESFAAAGQGIGAAVAQYAPLLILGGLGVAAVMVLRRRKRG